MSRQIRTSWFLAVPALAMLGCVAEDSIDIDTCGPPEVYRIDTLQVPANNTEAHDLAFDLNGDEAVDNQVGMVMGALHNYFDQPFDLGASANQHLNADVTWTIGLRRCAGDHVLVSIVNMGFQEGGDPGAAHELVGRITGGQIRASGEGGELPMSALFDPPGTFADAGWLTSELSVIRFADPGATDRIDGRVGLAPFAVDAVDAIARPMLPFIQTRAKNNPTLVSVFDVNKDGEITLEEVKAANLTQSLLYPDLRVGSDRSEPTALSLGLGFSATRVP